MKFEWPTSQPDQTGASDCASARFTLERSPFAGQTFNAVLRVCGNPCCPCGAVKFECRRDDASGQELGFDLDVFKRELDTRLRSAPDAVALGRAFHAEAEAAQWESLRQAFLTFKRREMESMDLDTLDVRLPSDVMAGDGTMVGYFEIFPWAESLALARDTEEWIVDDQYCVRPDCNCTETGLTFIRVTAEIAQRHAPGRWQTFLFYNYRTGKIDEAKAQPGGPSPRALLETLRATIPNLDETLRRRHGQLKQLGRRLLPKARRLSGRSRPQDDDLAGGDSAMATSAPSAPVRVAPKVGRNDPCPCGSGKKYKKCCGAA